jgi:hypothetical protein
VAERVADEQDQAAPSRLQPRPRLPCAVLLPA